MKLNFKLLALALIVFASNVQAISFGSVKESANNTINYGKEKLNKAGLWVSSHKKEVIIGGIATVVALGGGVCIYKLNKDLRLQTLENRALKRQVGNLTNDLATKQDYIGRIRPQLPIIKASAANNQIAYVKSAAQLKEAQEKLSKLEKVLAMQTAGSLDSRREIERLAQDFFARQSSHGLSIQAQVEKINNLNAILERAKQDSVEFNGLIKKQNNSFLFAKNKLKSELGQEKWLVSKLQNALKLIAPKAPKALKQMLAAKHPTELAFIQDQLSK